MDIFVNMSSVVVWFLVMFLSMLPIIEARFAIPLGVSSEIWGSGALDVWQSMLAGIIGSTIVGIVLIISYKWIKSTLSKSKLFGKVYNAFLLKLLSKFNKKIKSVKVDEKRQKKNYRIKFWSMLIFLILPVPGSGVWSCAILGSLLGLKIRDNIIVIVVGNLVSCLFVAVISAILIEYITLILIISAIITIMYVLIKLLERCINKHNKKELSV